MVLVGRIEECARIDALLDSVRDGLSGTLVVHGEAGFGKTALLDYARNRADDLTVLRLTGVESERDLGFAALQRLLAPLRTQIGQLPGPQRQALNSALGLAAGPPANPFLVGLGVVTIGAHAAEAGGGLLCIVDDAQWVDSESIAALAFWGRRLQADRVALIFGERGGPLAAGPLDGLPTLGIARLDEDSARTLFVAQAGFELDRDVLDRILAETEGNPLAIVELAKDLTPDSLVGWASVPEPLPLTRRLEERFAGLARTLPADTQLFLLLVAAGSTDDAELVWTAAGHLGVTRKAAEAAEAADLVLLGSSIRYRHPLIRSAVYGSATPADRRAVHGALAAVTDPADADRWAWHRAGSVIGPDEEVAALLERRAQRAISSGATSAAMALLSRAAELTPKQEQAAERRVAAAEAAQESGLVRQAHTLVEQALPKLRAPGWAARAQRAHALADLRDGRLAAAAPNLLVAAVGLLPADAVLGRRTLLEAVDTALYCGDAAQSEFMRSIAATDPKGLPGQSSVVDGLLHAYSTHARAGYAAAVPAYRQVLDRCENAPPQELAPWTNLIAAAARALWDDSAHDLVLRRVAEWSRAQGALQHLSTALSYLASSALWRGQLRSSAALFAEAEDVRQAAGEVIYFDGTLEGFRGQEAACSAKVRTARAVGEHLGLGALIFSGHIALLELRIGLGQYDEALRSGRVLFEGDPALVGPHLLPDLIEAAVRVGDRDAAEEALQRLTERVAAAGTPWARGLLARSEALMAGDDGEELYASALELLGATPVEHQRARVHLVYGEWLRRQKRRTDARDQLRQAYDMFAAMGAGGFAERARAELLATGAQANRRTVETLTALTPQESQVARLAAVGESNATIAAQLFISANTVDYHLRKVFRKLSVTSRRRLRTALAEVESQTLSLT